MGRESTIQIQFINYFELDHTKTIFVGSFLYNAALYLCFVTCIDGYLLTSGPYTYWADSGLSPSRNMRRQAHY